MTVRDAALQCYPWGLYTIAAGLRNHWHNAVAPRWHGDQSYVPLHFVWECHKIYLYVSCKIARSFVMQPPHLYPQIIALMFVCAWLRHKRGVPRLKESVKPKSPHQPVLLGIEEHALYCKQTYGINRLLPQLHCILENLMVPTPPDWLLWGLLPRDLK